MCVGDEENAHDDVIRWKHFPRAGNSPASGEFPAQRPVTRSFDVFFDLCLNTRLREQPWGWWFETLLRPFWRHCNARMGTMPVQSMCFEHFSTYYKIVLKMAGPGQKLTYHVKNIWTSWQSVHHVSLRRGLISILEMLIVSVQCCFNGLFINT